MTQPTPLAQLPADPEAEPTSDTAQDAAAVALIAGLLAAAGSAGATYAAAETARAGITAALKGLGLSAAKAARLIAFDAARPAPPIIPLSPQTRSVAKDGPTYRASYLVNAARRLGKATGQSVKAATGAPATGPTLGDAVGKERRYFRQHQNAQTAREQAAQRIDAAANSYGPIVGWYAVLDERTTPECRAAHGRSFYPAHPPRIGLPGLKHAGNCRCRPGPPIPGAPLVDPTAAPHPPTDTTVAAAREGSRVAIELAAPKPLPDGQQMYPNGLTYNPKTKTFHPTTDAEKNAGKGGKGGDFNSKHPRAASGSPTGGQFVPVGQARDANASKAQQDRPALDAYRTIGQAKPADRKAALGKLNTDELGKLSRLAYSFRSADPRLVALRTAIAAELGKRKLKVTDYGALGMASDAPAVELSAKTAGYSATHSPLGRPGGPGLWGHKGWQLPAYVQNVAKGIMESGATRSKAIEIAVGKIRDWAQGRGNVSPEVRAAARKAIAEWEALKARAGAVKLSRLADAIELAAANGDHKTVNELTRRSTGHAADTPQEIEMAATKPGQRYRHGWIPVTPGGAPKLNAASAHASRLTVLDGVKARRAYAAGLSDQDLAVIDTELTRRAASLGKPGQVAAHHRVVKEEITKRKASAPSPGARLDPAVVKSQIAALDQRKKSGQITSVLHAQQRTKLLKQLAAAQNTAGRKATRLSRDEPAVELARTGKAPTAADVRNMVAAHAKVPDKLKGQYRKKVIGHARKAGALHHVPKDWLTKGDTTDAPTGKAAPFGGKKANPFGAKK